jgi:hypothetical protein
MRCLFEILIVVLAPAPSAWVTSFMSFHGSTLLYAECVSSNIGVSTACFELRQGDTDQDPNRDYD